MVGRPDLYRAAMAPGPSADDPAGSIDRSAFYTGLVAELYGALRAADPDPAPYERFVRRWGELDVTLYLQTMEAMDLPVRYRCMYLAGASFNLVPDDASASRALRGIADHLQPGGGALVPLFVPEPVTPGAPPTRRELDDGTILSCGPIAAMRDDEARLQVVTLELSLIHI